AVAAEYGLLSAEHVHGPPFALVIAAAPAGQFGHHAIGVHAGCQHVAMIAVSGYDLIALLQGHLHPDHDGFLADIKVAETADRAHAVELAGLFLEAADQQHVPERSKLLRLGEFRWGPVCLLP